MDRLRQLAPWQIIAIAAGALVICLIGGYLLVTALTSTKPAAEATSDIPVNLDSDENREVVKKLETFDPPNNLPIVTNPLRTPDPNAPSTVNPFE